MKNLQEVYQKSVSSVRQCNSVKKMPKKMYNRWNKKIIQIDKTSEINEMKL